MMETRTLQDEYIMKYSDKELIGRFWKYLITYKLQLVFIILLVLAISGVSIVPPLMVERAFNLLEESGEWITVAPFAIAYI